MALAAPLPALRRVNHDFSWSISGARITTNAPTYTARPAMLATTTRTNACYPLFAPT